MRPTDTMEEMEADIRAAVGDGAVTDEVLKRLHQLARVGRNWSACRWMTQYMRGSGKLRSARMYCMIGVLSGDPVSARTMLEERLLEPWEGEDFLYNQLDAQTFARTSVGIDGFSEWALEYASSHPEAADVMATGLRRDPDSIPLYSRFLEIGLEVGSPVAMHLRASDILYPGFSGGSVDHEEALRLMRTAADVYWRASLVMGQLLFVGRYVERDEAAAAEYISAALRMSGQYPAVAWNRYLSESPDLDSEAGSDEPFRVIDLPEWKVLEDVTASWGGSTQYTQLSNSGGQFENGTFAILSFPASRWLWRCPSGLLFKPTGLVISNIGCSDESVSVKLSESELRGVLRACVDSARDSVRGMGRRSE